MIKKHKHSFKDFPMKKHFISNIITKNMSEAKAQKNKSTYLLTENIILTFKILYLKTYLIVNSLSKLKNALSRKNNYIT